MVLKFVDAGCFLVTKMYHVQPNQERRGKGLSRVALCTAFIVCFVHTSLAAMKGPYDGAQILQVPRKPEHLFEKQLKRGEAEVLYQDGSHRDVLVAASALDKVYNTLRKYDIMYGVVDGNVQRSIDIEEKANNQSLFTGARTHGDFKLDWNGYYRLEDIYDMLDALAINHPTIIQVETIGYSIEGRPIKMAKINSQVEGAKKIWIDGGVHAREWISPAAVTYIIRQLVLTDHWLPVDFYIVPVLNPDGYEYSHDGKHRFWRKNKRGVGDPAEMCKGVDLNRNFDSQTEAIRNCNRDDYPGPHRFSEPESTAVGLFLTNKSEEVKGFITFHSYAQTVLYPYGYRREPHYNYDNVKDVARKLASALSAVHNQTYTSQSVLQFTGGKETRGSSADWAYEIGIEYPYGIELRPSSGPSTAGFLLPPEQILPTAQEAWEAVKVLAIEIDKLSNN